MSQTTVIDEMITTRSNGKKTKDFATSELGTESMELIFCVHENLWARQMVSKETIWATYIINVNLSSYKLHVCALP